MTDHHHDDRTEEFVRALDSLFARAIRGGADRDTMLQATLDAGTRAVGGHRGFLALVNHETGELRLHCTYGDGWTPQNRAMRLHLAQEAHRGITGHVAL